MNKLIRMFAFAAAVALAAVIALYVYKFGVSGGTRLSDDPEDWARFGEYVGGTLGAAYGLLAFAGVLLTIHLQSTQLELQRNQISLVRRQAQLDELQRLVASVSRRVDELCDAEPEGIATATFVRLACLSGPLTITKLVTHYGAMRVTTPPLLPEEQLGAAIREMVRTLRFDCALIAAELGQLARCVSEYSDAGGSPVVADFYRRRYDIFVCCLEIVGIIDSKILASFFRTAERRAWMIGQKTAKEEHGG